MKRTKKAVGSYLSSHCIACVDIIMLLSCFAVTRMTFKIIDKMTSPDYMILMVYSGAIVSILTGKLIQGGKHLMDRKANR